MRLIFDLLLSVALIVLDCNLLARKMSYVYGDGLDFLAMADWGGQNQPPYTTPEEIATAQIMGEIAEQHSASFVVSLGDNFYLWGVQNDTDPRFDETFEDVFTADSLSNIPFHVIAGNHDWYGNVQAQIDYTTQSERWNFPDFYYTKVFEIPNTEYTLEIVFIDTQILAGFTVDEYYYCLLLGGNHDCSMMPVGPPDEEEAEVEWDFISNALASSTADFLIVGGHYPVWSIAEHGPTDALVDRLRPMLLEHEVQLYMCGHDHTMEYLQETDNPDTGFVVAGAAHDCASSLAHYLAVPSNSLQYHDCNQGGFVRVHIDENGMTVYYYLGNSKQVTHTTKTFGPRSKETIDRAKKINQEM